MWCCQLKKWRCESIARALEQNKLSVSWEIVPFWNLMARWLAQCAMFDAVLNIKFIGTDNYIVLIFIIIIISPFPSAPQTMESETWYWLAKLHRSLSEWSTSIFKTRELVDDRRRWSLEPFISLSLFRCCRMQQRTTIIIHNYICFLDCLVFHSVCDDDDDSNFSTSSLSLRTHPTGSSSTTNRQRENNFSSARNGKKKEWEVEWAIIEMNVLLGSWG